MKVDKFILLLILMIFLGYFFPQIGEVLPLKEISTYGIAGIFFFYGLKLSPSKLKAGLSNWKLHILIQSTTFLLFPLLVLGLYPLANTEEYKMYWMALFFLAALPSTVSSSVVMVSIARGNLPAAILNASASGLIGIFMTPFWMSLVLSKQAEGGFAFEEIIWKLFLQIILPVFIGITLHRYWGKWAEKHKGRLSMFDKGVILIIVYNSFRNSFINGIFDRMAFTELITMMFIVILLFFIVLKLNQWTTKKLKFNREDRITALFCGTKKSLVHGTVFSNVLFSGMAGAGIFLVPIMLYHAFQLFYISILAEKYHQDQS